MPPFQKTLDGEIIVDTGHRGHASPWTKEQGLTLAASLPSLIKFSFEENGKLDRRDSKLTKWKHNEADRLLQLPEFQVLENMSVAKARDSIVQKFTNYRNRHLKPNAISDTAQRDFETRKLAAAALVDWKMLNKGRSYFKRKNYAKIIN